jgi:putative transposase
MPRSARLIYPGNPHHVVQRGNRRQRVFFGPADYQAYLGFAAEAVREAGVEIWGYCLMPNHVHLIATPRDEGGLTQAMKAIHARYTRRINARENWRGHLWQARYSSSPMDDGYLRHCLRYVAFNPVRSGLVARPDEWPWSSARAHVLGAADGLLTTEPVLERFGRLDRGFFDDDASPQGIRALRGASVTGRPVGALEWLKRLTGERATTGDTHSPYAG